MYQKMLIIKSTILTCFLVHKLFTLRPLQLNILTVLLLLWYRGEMHLILNNGSISIIGKDGGLLKQEITTVPFEVESVIPYLK